jgi:hypothetical protein
MSNGSYGKRVARFATKLREGYMDPHRIQGNGAPGIETAYAPS